MHCRFFFYTPSTVSKYSHQASLESDKVISYSFSRMCHKKNKSFACTHVEIHICIYESTVLYIHPQFFFNFPTTKEVLTHKSSSCKGATTTVKSYIQNQQHISFVCILIFFCTICTCIWVYNQFTSCCDCSNGV